MESSGALVRLAKWLGLLTALLISFGTPAAYLHFGYQRVDGEVAGEIRYKAQQLSQLIGGNPEYWQFEDLRIGELIKQSGEGDYTGQSRVFDSAGNQVVQVPAETPDFTWPTLTQRRQLFDYGVPAGDIEITHSLKPLYRQTILVAVGSLVLGFLTFWALRMVPLRLLQSAWNRISYLASHDALTNLPNRVLFIDRLQHALAGSVRGHSLVAVYSLDLDHFKDVNDTLGHAMGDLLLKRVTERVKTCLRQDDTLARLGGDEFAIIQTGLDEPRAASVLAERIISVLSKPFELDGNEAVIGVSIGIAMAAGDDATDSDEILKGADLALYKSKVTGRGNYHFFRDEMDAELRARKAMEADLRKAFNDEELEVHYQPQVSLDAERITAVEALVRWHHPERGDVHPSEFIPVAGMIGLIRPLTEWVLRKACGDALNWAPLKVAVNLSPSLFKQPGLVVMVERVLKETGLPPDRLELEITEDILIDETERTLSVLSRLKKLGVHIAMDDFGTGYSSLSYLRQFPFDKIKIDHSFISEFENNEDAQAIVRAIIGMSRALKMRINAEGVETVEQAELLRAAGCEEVQGFLYGRPMSKNDMEAMLDSPAIDDAAKKEAVPLRA